MSCRRKDGLSGWRRLQYVHVLVRWHARVLYACLSLIVHCGSSTPPMDGGADAATDVADSASDTIPSCAALGENCGGSITCCEGVCIAVAGDPTSTCN